MWLIQQIIYKAKNPTIYNEDVTVKDIYLPNNPINTSIKEKLKMQEKNKNILMKDFSHTIVSMRSSRQKNEDTDFINIY